MEKNVIIAEIRLYIPSSITAPDLDMAAITRPQTASTRAPTIDILSAFSSMRPCSLITLYPHYIIAFSPKQVGSQQTGKLM